MEVGADGPQWLNAERTDENDYEGRRPKQAASRIQGFGTGANIA